jgi:hypothetical protein
MEPLQAIVEFWYEDDARKMEVDPVSFSLTQMCRSPSPDRIGSLFFLLAQPRLASGQILSV